MSYGSYEEMRTPVSVFGSLPVDSPLLVDVPTTPGHAQQRIHKLALPDFLAMSAAVEKQLGFPLEVASGHRPHRWPSRQEYERVIIAKYGSVARGRLFLAFDSPHETGLPVDFGCGGLSPVSATIAWQRERPLHLWLMEYAWQYGWHPYKVEPWHWEHWVDLESYRTGEIQPTSADDSGPLTCSDPNDVCVEAPLDDVLATPRSSTS